METRVALFGIVVEKIDSTERMNALLHQYGEYIVNAREAIMSINAISMEDRSFKVKW